MRMTRPITTIAWQPAFLAALVVATPGLAQDTEPGRTAEVGGTEIGERQTREEVAPNIEPIRRIANRVQNRVQNRIRNRIDRNYDPYANATKPFEVAADQARVSERRSPR
jgi:hypothetical protein